MKMHKRLDKIEKIKTFNVGKYFNPKIPPLKSIFLSKKKQN